MTTREQLKQTIGEYKAAAATFKDTAPGSPERRALCARLDALEYRRRDLENALGMYKTRRK